MLSLRFADNTDTSVCFLRKQLSDNWQENICNTEKQYIYLLLIFLGALQLDLKVIKSKLYFGKYRADSQSLELYKKLKILSYLKNAFQI